MKNKYITAVIILIGILAVILILKTKHRLSKKQDRKEKRIEMRDSLKQLHPDTIIKYREIRWEEKKAKIDAKFDSLKIAKDTITK
tara:strand:+ start:554 stop:808 length:255 start_codon:yes stop_codon:yes gene_type:complete